MFYKRNITYLGIFLAVLTPFLIKTNTKNTCSSYFDYLLINFNGKCHYNPDVDLSVPEIIEKYAGSVQVYNVTTEDGYILTMFRILRENPVGVVLLQPPISTGSIAWLSDGSESLAFTLWEKGYDVWLSNHRGASYSRKHVNLTVSDPKFWDYSFHEIALYDLEAQFEIIRKETDNSRMIYIGYSMSSTEALIYASLKPEKAEQFVKNFILIAPIAYMRHFESVFRFLFYVMKPFEKLFRLGEFMTFEPVRWLGHFVNIVPSIVNIMTSIIMGWTPTEMDPVLYPYVFAHHGRGITNKMIYHYMQIFFNQGHFSMYDYGEDVNKEVYGSTVAPLYPLQEIKTPMYIIYGDNDNLGTPLDVKLLCDKLLPKETVSAKIPIYNHNHIDFIFSRHRTTKTYQTILDIMDEIKYKKTINR